MTSDKLDIRTSPLAGRWYDADPLVLAACVDGMLALRRAWQVRREAYPLGLIAPHAGLRFSGRVAGRAFSLLAGSGFETVVLVGPSHYPLPHKCYTTAHDTWQTPLGHVPVDRELTHRFAAALKEPSGRVVAELRDDNEHSLEMELPFLQRVLPAFRILPVVMVDQSVEAARAIGNALASVLADRRALLVASSDLSHFYSREKALELDQELLRRVESFDPEAVIRAEAEGVGFACGRGAIATVLIAARQLGGVRTEILHHATSGDVSGDFSSVVGYAAGAIWSGN